MTDRKPDILTSWKIKQNTDGSYTARCPAMPNVELTAENVVTILSKIERCLKSMYPDNSTVDGGISCINAEYSVTKRQEMSLESFEMPSDDPTPEPATDAPELHEVHEKCKTCAILREDGSCILSHSPETCTDYVSKEPPTKKKSKAKKSAKDPFDKLKDGDDLTVKDVCDLTDRVVKSRAKNTAKAPVEEPLIQAPKKPAKKAEKTSKERLDELMNEDPEYEDKVADAIEHRKGYVWKRITKLEDTCGNCINCGADCKGNPRGEPCENYNACNNSSEQCVKCEHMSRGYGNTGFCTLHNDTVGHDDYACKSFVLSEKIKEWSKEE